jgi:hypothetical protein
MRVSANARRGRDLDKPLGSEWFPDVAPERRRAAAVRFVLFMAVFGGGGIALGIWIAARH